MTHFQTDELQECDPPICCCAASTAQVHPNPVSAGRITKSQTMRQPVDTIPGDAQRTENTTFAVIARLKKPIAASRR
jgi:hypothetical protein